MELVLPLLVKLIQLYIFENINEGYLNLLKNNKLVIIKELNNIEDFISKSIEIKNNNLNKLF